jgi:hypothetical protein
VQRLAEQKPIKQRKTLKVQSSKKKFTSKLVKKNVLEKNELYIIIGKQQKKNQ